MRGLFSQDRAISPTVLRPAMLAFGSLLAVFALLIVLHALYNVFSGAFLVGLVQLTGGLGLLLGIFLIVRLMVELLWALHRLNDRLTILSDDLRQRQAPDALRARPDSTDT